MKRQDKKQNTILFISSNTFLSLPPVKQLVQMFVRDFKIVYSQIKVKDYENFFPEHKENNDILVFESYATYMSQSFAQKILKYWRTFTYLLTNLKSLSKENDTVVIYTIDLFTLCVASFLKWKNTKLVYHQFETLEPENMNKIDKFLLKLLSKRFDKVDLAILPEVNRMEFFKEQIKTDVQEKFFLLPNTNNRESVGEINQRLTSKTVIAHIGTVGSNTNVRHYLEAIKRIPNPDFEFWFIGRIGSDILKLIVDTNAENIKYINQVPHHILDEYYKQIDLGIILYNDSSLNLRYCAPNKLYEYWSYGIPVIGDILPGLMSVFNNDLQGRLIHMSNVDAFVETILELSKGSYKNRSSLLQLFFKEYRLSNYYDKMLSELKTN